MYRGIEGGRGGGIYVEVGRRGREEGRKEVEKVGRERGGRRQGRR